MAYDVNKKATVGQVKTLAKKVKDDYTTAAQVDKAITDKGYQTADDVNGIIDGKGYQTANDVNGIIDGKGYQTQAQVESAINTAVSSAYKAKGSVAFAGLPTPAADNLGNVYNVSEEFTTSDAFVEGAGKKYPAGTNVAVVEPTTGTYKLDVMAGFINTDSFLTDADVATDTEFNEMMAEVFTPAT